ncbi:unnamed protein product [Effrenium voratum]|nr:unnamed protein product [Effrenium voratum]
MQDLDLAGFAEGQRCFESDEESAVAFHLLLGAGSRRAIGLALAPTSLAMAVEENPPASSRRMRLDGCLPW